MDTCVDISSSSTLLLATLAFLACALLIAVPAALAVSFHPVSPGQALVVSTVGADPRVSLRGRIVLPFLQRAEVMDLSLKVVAVDRVGPRALRFADGASWDVRARFFVRVLSSPEDVLRVARTLGCVNASTPEKLAEFLAPALSDALTAAAARGSADALTSDTQPFKRELLETIGHSLAGLIVEDAVFDSVRPTSAEAESPSASAADLWTSEERFRIEKEFIEVVAAKERELIALRQELDARNAELQRLRDALAAQRAPTT